MELIYLIVGVVVGGVVGFLFMRMSLKTKVLEAVSEKEKVLAELREEKSELGLQNAVIESSLSEKQKTLKEIEEKFEQETKMR